MSLGYIPVDIIWKTVQCELSMCIEKSEKRTRSLS
jgi:hypothetical protein